MGLKDKLKKYNEEHKDDGFHPLELNEGNVQAIFNRCFGAKGADGQSTEGCYVRYDGKIWTDDKATMVKFYHFREAALLTHVNFKPTLSPKGPAFPA